ncbi:MAG: hypothetical protein COV44_10170 [Deltaproteobacteria bacterium CG11_big_fil_rev_8_21_14_0_20_45_16]|nr:MAG: hypothetical protein COV44_10170 [Deltaproteobacteria bacterium CG11_big_fil_rev_8_21_14_0_20_45_16]
MYRALSISVSFHLLLFAGVYWSAQLSLMLIKSQIKKEEIGGVIQVDLLYKPTDTAMRKSPIKRELPPPKVKTKVKEDLPTLVKKVKPKPISRPAEPKKDFKALFDKIRDETGLDRERAPKEDNFPTNVDGEKDARGTGGRSLVKMSPAQLALQTAARKHYRLPQALDLRKKHPNALGYISVKLIGMGNSLQIVSLDHLQRSGFNILDQACENALRHAMNEETFAPDIVAELSGKENTITCQF